MLRPVTISLALSRPKSLGGGPADAGSGARDQHDFVVESIHGLLLEVAGGPAVRED